MGDEKGCEGQGGRYSRSRLDNEAGTQLENSNPAVNVVGALAGHNEE